MKIFDLIREESDVSIGRLLFISVVSGTTNAALLVIVNTVLGDRPEISNSFRLLTLFVVFLAVFAITRKHLLIAVTQEIEQILHKVRTRLADKIRRVDLLRLEKLGRAEIYASVQRETLSISAIGKPLVTVFQSVLLSTLTLLYIAYLSPWAFLYSAGIIIGASFFYLVRKRRLSAALREVLSRENKVFETLDHLLDGIKEIQLNDARSEEVMGYARSRSASARDLRVGTEAQFVVLSVFAQIALYGGLGILVFVLPELYPEYGPVAFQVTMAFVFLFNPVSTIVGLIPDLYRAEVAIGSISEIEAQLDEALLPPGDVASSFTSFREIRLVDVFFRFDDPRSAQPFSVGPVDLTIPAGEVLFLCGGNGTGKSTLVKLVTGLYRAQQGALLIDGTEVGDCNYKAYQALFSTVFSDFHLFDRLYGLGEVDSDRLEELFEELGLTGKTQIVDGEFATLDLSTGQRKRLALLVALLEDRPIFVFDEWAAEQDPVFRRKFYREIIPQLKSKGKTVIAVTHDDRYYSSADTVLKVEEGKLVNNQEE